MARKIADIRIEDRPTKALVEIVRRERGMPTLAGAARVLIHERCSQLRKSARRRGELIGGSPKAGSASAGGSGSEPVAGSGAVHG